MSGPSGLSRSHRTTPITTPTIIPRILYTFWHEKQEPTDELVRACISCMRRWLPMGWEFHVLHGDEKDLESPPVPASSMSTALLSDWYRLTALRKTGGIYMDASCIPLNTPEAWVDMQCKALQGFVCRLDNETMESWALACPRADALVAAWHDELRRAITRGVGAYCDDLCDLSDGSVELRGVMSDGLRPALPYLTIHAAWRVARFHQPAAPLRMHPSVAPSSPCFYLRVFHYDSLAAISAVFAADAGAELTEGAPFLKLRKCDRECVPPLASLGRGSWLARQLMPPEVDEAAEPAGRVAAGSAVSSRLEWLMSR